LHHRVLLGIVLFSIAVVLLEGNGYIIDLKRGASAWRSADGLEVT
jgi:hypothetical protein